MAWDRHTDVAEANLLLMKKNDTDI